jgi:hypothetical protein
MTSINFVEDHFQHKIELNVFDHIHQVVEQVKIDIIHRHMKNP